MYYIKIVEGNPIGYPLSEQNIRESLPNISLPLVLKPEDILEYGYIPFQFSLPPEVQRFQSIVEIDPELVDGIMIQRFSLREMGEQEKQAIIDTELEKSRNLQKSLLADSDWTELSSVRAKHSEEWADAWNEYRTLLRDVDKQESWPFDLSWPKIPGDLES
jgi:hypothetical protein